MTRLALDPIFDSYAVVVAVALLLLGVLCIGPSAQHVGRGKRAALLLLRAVTVLLLVAALLRPTLVYTEKKQQSATVVMLIDQSRSMSVGDGIGGKSRWELLRRAVRDAKPSMARLAEDFELKAYAFDEGAHPLKLEQGAIVLGEKPEGQQTAIGAVLEEVLQREAGKRLLAVLLLSDGAQRAYAPRDLPPQTAAERLRSMGTPLFTFPFGQSLGLGQVRDAAVTQLLVNESVFEKNELAVDAEMRVAGYANQEIPLRLLFETSPGQLELVTATKVIPKANGRPLAVRLNYTPQRAGEFKLRVEIPAQAGELVTTNNGLSTFVNVLKGGLSVLYLEGTLRPEATFLRRALGASPDISVRYNRIDAQRPETRPGDLSEALQPGKYDVYILGDLDAAAFEALQLQSLARAVDQGAGLIMLGGAHSFGPGGYASTPLAEVLPVAMEATERQRFDDPIRPDVHVPGPLQMRPTQAGLLHFPLMLAGSREENEAAWAQLPPLRGANRFSPSRLAPGALVRADAGPNVPLLVDHHYGQGRVIAFAGDSTWRWWLHGFESEHKRFWRQVVLWLARKDQSTDRVWVRLAKRRYAPASRVEFSVGTQSAAGEPIGDAQYEVQVVLPDDTRRPLQLTRQGDQATGSLRGTETKAAGDYAIEVTAHHQGTLLGQARARFLVFQQDLELDNAAADVGTLESLASMTGGESLAGEQLPELIERLAKKTEALQIEQETKEPFWDTWPFLLVLVGLLTLEWYLRKRWRLV